MGILAAGEVVLLLYPFSDLSRNKYRPAVVLAEAGREDWIVCQITSNPFADLSSIRLTQSDFAIGQLRHDSYARPTKVFTAHESLITSSLGTLKREQFETIRDAVIDLLRKA